MTRCPPATLALLLLLSPSMTSVSASEYNDGSVPSVQHVMRKTFIVARHEEQRLGTTHLSTNDDDFEWMRIVPHSIESDISSKSPSNDDPDFVEQLLQTSIAIDGGTRSRTRSPTFGPSGQMATSSKSPTTTASFPLHSAMPTEQASAIPTRGEVTIDVNATQVVTTAPPTAASSPFTTADEPTGIPTLRSTEPPTSGINVTASSDENSISLSQVPTISKPTGIPTTSSTAPSELGSSQHNQKHDRDGHVSNNDDETPSYIGEVNGGDDDILRVDLPRIICDMTLSPRLLQQTLERKHVLVTTMTDMIHDLFDAHLRKPIYDLRNISLTVEVKWNEDENLDPEVRMHAHYRGSSFFSPGTSPTRDDLTDLLVRYFDVDEFTARLMLHRESRGDGSVVVVNSVHFTLEDGTLIQAGIEDEENALPNNAGAPTGQGMQVLLLSGVIVMACLLALTTFLWPRGDDEEDAIGGASSCMDRSRIDESFADSSSAAAIVGARGKVIESDDENPPSDDSYFASSRKSSRYTASSYGVSSLSESPYTAKTRSPPGLLDDASPIANYISHLGLFSKRPFEDEIMARIVVEEAPWRVLTFSPTTESI